MKKKNKGAISIFALLSMMFFLIFIMVAYNNVIQKGKTQVETESVLVAYYKGTQSAVEISSAIDGGNISVSASAAEKNLKLKEQAEQSKLTNDNKNKFVCSNDKIYKIQ